MTNELSGLLIINHFVFLISISTTPPLLPTFNTKTLTVFQSTGLKTEIYYRKLEYCSENFNWISN